ncbi:MAG: DUF433 domain-containing protein [Nitrospinae bacterium]|nr:DUF433 domain-containing protein [Nitrospinota bacterium]
MISERIEISPRVCNGKPVIKGTRIPMTVLLDQLAVGQNLDAHTQAYPEITTEGIKTALP